MKNFSYVNRLQNLSKMKSQEFDLIIIGGGINGAGVARDACARGMSVALVESRDFASGTSSRSSKMVHGGIRYLENMDFKLVYEALNERNKLFEMAPHLVHPLRFMLPLYKESRVGMLKMGLGMWLYDILALFQSPEMHERLDAKESMERMTDLREKDLLGAYVYSDGYMDDDRLVFETLRSANEMGMVAANYVTATGAQFGADGKISAVHCEDQISKDKFMIRGRHVISSVGPWTDQLGDKLFKDWKKILRPTKGIHLTLPQHRLPLTSAVVMGAEKGDRIVFGIPRHDMIIIGTTDTDFKESPENVTVTPEDVKYLLDITSHYFPGANLTAHDVISSYAGVRPLVNDGSSTEGKTSREHTIIDDPRGVTFVAGGKYTTYRLMCQQTVSHALRSFPMEDRGRFAKKDTAVALNEYTTESAFHEAQVLVHAWAKEFGRPVADVAALAQRYGREAEVILTKYDYKYTYWQLEAAQAIDSTMCLNLRDFFSRRVHLFLADRNHGLKHLDEIVQVFQEKLSWTDKRIHEEKHALSEYMGRELEWKKHL
ncbi:glycerol-3-phosphate dehydrogenase/oxidase [Bdellovibrio sp. SKB1291214]|uniref:glycerol-3-phosphate dehydrogenase/oxidase n=1 Tax=Bdellovibrio sp. SKB1291214 TaxID=1732569 RepID=UPI000B517790|nr:glycerol-3-phosphate dehydrogenase/oxidase [Bdellovibrio sp. SKB1291214]UYL10387.1 glycerol-3-phosphate dehydrogenase/oxidase [Bdellovibrio sp. SKB1291214]